MVSQSAGIDYAKETEAKAIISYLDDNGNWTNSKEKKSIVTDGTFKAENIHAQVGDQGSEAEMK